MAARDDPYGNFNFLVEIDKMTVAGFAEVSGLGESVDVIAYREGGDTHVRKLPGLRKTNDITMKRGVTQSRALFDWYRNVANGVPDRRDGTIVLLDASRTPVVRWLFVSAFPCRWEGPHLNATGNAVALETLVLACEGIALA